MSRTGPPIRRRLAWRLEAFAFDGFGAALRLLPIDAASALGAVLFKALGPLTPSHKVAEANLRLAFPELDPGARARLLQDQWESLGRSFFEFPLVHRLTPASGRVEVVGAERLARVAEGGRPVVFVSGHFSNFEVMAAAILDAGVTCQITYRAANNPWVDRSIRERRARYGVKLFAPKGSDGARELLVSLAAGESVAIMNDQKFNGGVRVRFFGHPADAAPGPTRLALRFGTVLQPMSVERTRGARFRVIAHEPITPLATGDRQRDLTAGTQAVTDFVEQRVRARPAEWFWVHRRWPREVYAGLEARTGG